MQPLKSVLKSESIAPQRMSLKSITSGRQKRPLRIVLAGVEGVGKSSFAAAAPSPIFLACEEGTAHLDVQRFPKPEKWTDVLEAIRTLETEPHEFKTLVVDTVDAAQPLLWAHICARDSSSKTPLKSVEDYGYGKGYEVALDEWRVFLAALDRLRDRGMNIVLIAHSHIKPFKNPEGLDFDRYEIKLHHKAAGLVKEWSDCVLFANFETIAAQDRLKRVRGVSTGARFLYTTRTAAYDAKNRQNLPESLPLSWDEFSAAVEANQTADSATLTLSISEAAEGLDAATKAQVAGYLTVAGTDGVKLGKLLAWVNSKLILGEQQ